MERITLYDLVSLIAMCDFELTLRVFGEYEELISYKGRRYTDIVWILYIEIIVLICLRY